MKTKLKQLELPNLTPIIVLAVLSLALTFLSPVFLTVQNLTNILQQVSVNAIIALGISIVIFTGGIDLSVGSILAASGVIMGQMMLAGIHPAIAVAASVLIGAVGGALNGVLISVFKLQPMIATLGTMSIGRGVALVVTDGRTVTGYSAGFRWIGTGSIPGTNIPVQIALMLLLYTVMFYVMKYRKTGRYIYSIGGNEEATRLSGINVMKYKTIAYIISGAMAAIAGIVLVARLNSAQAIAGEGFELDAIASAVIGGASLRGGHGSVWGTILGAIIIGVIRNGLNLLNVSSHLQRLILGFIIIAAVLLDSFRNNRTKKMIVD